MTVEKLAEHFSKCGLIRRHTLTDEPCVKIYKDVDGKSKGEGLVSYEKEESVAMAIELLHGKSSAPHPRLIRIILTSSSPHLVAGDTTMGVGHTLSVTVAEFTQKGDTCLLPNTYNNKIDCVSHRIQAFDRKFRQRLTGHFVNFHTPDSGSNWYADVPRSRYVQKEKVQLTEEEQARIALKKKEQASKLSCKFSLLCFTCINNGAIQTFVLH